MIKLFHDIINFMLPNFISFKKKFLNLININKIIKFKKITNQKHRKIYNIKIENIKSKSIFSTIQKIKDYIRLIEYFISHQQSDHYLFVLY